MAKKDSLDTIRNDINTLFYSQLDEWRLLSDNYDIYDQSPYDELLFSKVFWEGCKIQLNYRKASLSADLKAIADGRRPCFLCDNARPAEQRHVSWENYKILVNPYPASDIHFTIMNSNHTPQYLGERIVDMARLTRIMPDCCIFYNGPKCGASAPDHMHFQAVAIREAVNFMRATEYLTEICHIGKSRLYIPKSNMAAYGHFILEIKEDADIMPMFDLIQSSMPGSDESEPMMNVVAFKMENTTRIVIIPRKSHRPSCYGCGSGQMLISPASLEMMGKFITSRREDYERLDEQTMQLIYDEVGYTTSEVMGFIKTLSE